MLALSLRKLRWETNQVNRLEGLLLRLLFLLRVAVSDWVLLLRSFSLLNLGHWHNRLEFVDAFRAPSVLQDQLVFKRLRV